jgi:hypothetical protein
MIEELVPGERIELPTNGLQNRCSTAELTRLSRHFWPTTRAGLVAKEPPRMKGAVGTRSMLLPTLSRRRLEWAVAWWTLLSVGLLLIVSRWERRENI